MKKYRGEWLAIGVTKHEDSSRSRVYIDHDKDPDKLLERLGLSHGKKYITYAGPLIEEDRAVIL